MWGKRSPPIEINKTYGKFSLSGSPKFEFRYTQVLSDDDGDDSVGLSTETILCIFYYWEIEIKHLSR